MDARGQTAIGHQEVSPTAPRCAVQRTTLGQRVHTFLPPPFTDARRLILTESPSHLKVFPEVSARGRVGREGEREEGRCNRIITQGTSLKGTAAGGPIWALHPQTHTSIATTTGSECCLIMADRDECISSQLSVPFSFGVSPPRHEIFRFQSHLISFCLLCVRLQKCKTVLLYS